MMSEMPAATVKVLIRTSIGKRAHHTPVRCGIHPSFDQRSSLGRVLQSVPLERMPKLVVAQAQRCRGRPLVEPISIEGVLEQTALIVRDRGAEVAGGNRRSVGQVGEVANRFNGRGARWRGGGC